MRVILGIDVGTQGTRVIAASEDGRVLARASRPFQISAHSGASIHEQDARVWWQATVQSLSEILTALRRTGVSATDIVALGVDSTSGTILPVAADGRTLANAIMYNDGRAAAEANEINSIASAHCATHGYRFSSSFALSKILWIKRHKPDLFETAWKIIHATDYIAGMFTGNFGLTDVSSALKTGADLLTERWPPFIEDRLGIPASKLPELGACGRVLGTVSAPCASQTGLSTQTKVCAGMSDGTAAFLASGASRLGDFNSTIGTTLVLKGIWDKIVLDTQGRIYSHKHPAGFWLPGGASNVGGECLAVRFPNQDLQALDRQAIQTAPTDLIIYPLVREGERLPFMNPHARGFIADRHGLLDTLQCEPDVYFAAHLEGVAYTERMSYEVIEALGVRANPQIYTTGAASKSLEWRMIRASVLNRTLALPECADSAFGCCVLAAANTIYPDLPAASAAMSRIADRTAPLPRLVPRYQQGYEKFKDICRQKGYIV